MMEMQVFRAQKTNPNLKSSLLRISDLAFFAGITISCFGEVALIGYAINLPQMYYRGLLGNGIDFNTALLLLIIGNLILFAENKLKK
ncbi:MAG TPA: hypothetical protein VGA92_04255 [Candidatus Nitrosotenuis sp.]|jgi:membrane-bound ClpP family serine protease